MRTGCLGLPAGQLASFLRDVMAAHPDKEMLVLCGHTHGAGECQVLPNLRVLTGGAEYGRPTVQRMIEVPDASA